MDNINVLGYKRTKPFVYFTDGHTTVHYILLFTHKSWIDFAFKVTRDVGSILREFSLPPRGLGRDVR